MEHSTLHMISQKRQLVSEASQRQAASTLASVVRSAPPIAFSLTHGAGSTLEYLMWEGQSTLLRERTNEDLIPAKAVSVR